MTLRLALYSDQENKGNRSLDERLLRLIGVRHPTIGYVASSPEPHRIDFERRRAYYAQRGADLALYVDSETDDAGARAALLQSDAIHLSGGNTFDFSHWLEQRGWLEPLRRYATEGGVLVGVSAGAILMTHRIGTALFCGDVAERAVATYASLNLLPFGFWPHYVRGDEHGEALASMLYAAPGAVYACPDGAGIVVDGGHIELHGPVRLLGERSP